MDAIRALLAETGPADVAVCTWTAATGDLRQAERLLNDGNIRSLRFVVDRSFPKRKPDYSHPARGAVSARPARPSPKATDAICRALEVGAAPEDAARYAGATPEQMADWLGRHPFFARRVAEATARFEVRHAQVIDLAAIDGDWKAAAWLLERRSPERYGPPAGRPAAKPKGADRLDDLSARRAARIKGGAA